jgi:NifU-like protein involved in Fe-S cluster formation
MDDNSDFQARIQRALAAKRNLGEMSDADSVGTAGSADCGDMLRMWLKFRDDDRGRRVIDRATFQTFGCETAIAVASVATELLTGKTAEEAMDLSGEDLAAPLGALPPMKIHCAQLVEGALRNALEAGEAQSGKGTHSPMEATDVCAQDKAVTPTEAAPTLIESLRSGLTSNGKVRVVLKPGR